MRTGHPRAPLWKIPWKRSIADVKRMQPVSMLNWPHAVEAQAASEAQAYPHPQAQAHPETPVEPEKSSISRRAIFLHALAAWCVVRLALGVITLYVIIAVKHAPLTSAGFLQAWQQWDGTWYVSIGVNGYWVRAAAGFFPLYPMLIHAGTLIFGSGSALLLAMLISNLGSLAAFMGIGLLASHEAKTPGAAWRAIWITAAYPMAFYLVAPYTEGPFLALTVFAVYFARRGSWGWAAACGFFAGLIRPTGIVLMAPLVWEFGRQHGWWRREVWNVKRWREAPQRLARLRGALSVRTALAALLVTGALPLAFACVVAYDAIHYHNPMMYVYAQDAFWHHAQWTVWQSVSAIIGNMLHPPGASYFRVLLVVDISAAVVSIGVTLAAIRRLPVAFTLYMAALLYLLLTSPVPSRPEIIASSARYLLVAFPVVLILGDWTARTRRPWLLVAILSVGFVLQAIFAKMFLSGTWIE